MDEYNLKFKCLIFASIMLLAGCDEQALNDPYPNQPANSNTIYTAFTEQPKHLDPAKSYSAEEWAFIAQIYEPILEYNYLLRPYKLEPLIAAEMPKIAYNTVANTTTYHIKIKPDINYQPHPAFAKDPNGNYYYHSLSKAEAQKFYNILDFKHTGTRSLIAADFVNQVKRLADPTLNSPIFGLMGPYIVGLQDLREKLVQAYAANPNAVCLDLRDYDLAGVKVIDDYNYTITINGKYDQFKYWLEMLFFAPVPWEASKFYCQAGLDDHNINLDNYPIGTGPFYLVENNPERRMLMLKNPNFHADFYPSVGMPDDQEKGLLANAGKKLPFLDQVMFSLEREGIPYWDKFMQGYYDRSGISSGNFNAAMNQNAHNGIQLSEALVNKGVRLSISNSLSIGYWGFNMLDEVVGGYNDRAKKLRQAISLAFDVDEYITIFANGRGLIANQPIPPGIEGYTAAPTPNLTANLQAAKRLLVAAGYPEGRDSKTGKKLQIYYDVISSGDPNQRASYGWITKQFNKLGIELIVRGTDYNRFQDKMRNGTVQFYSFGWNSDYPDPENTLFLFYGPNGMAKFAGENASNYANPEFDKLFKQFKAMGDNPKRLPLIQQMINILQDDAPWIWGYFPQDYILSNPWYGPSKPNAVSLNTVKYAQVDPNMRAKLRMQWNQAIIWPITFVILGVVLIITPAWVGYFLSTKARARRVK